MSKKRSPVKHYLVTIDGFGKVPRTDILAPVVDPIEVTPEHLDVIMRTSKLTVRLVSPLDGHKVTVNTSNIGRMKQLYAGWVKANSTKNTPVEEVKTPIENPATTPNVDNSNIPMASTDDIKAAVDSAFASVIPNEPKKETVISPVKSIEEIAIKKDKK